MSLNFDKEEDKVFTSSYTPPLLNYKACVWIDQKSWANFSKQFCLGWWFVDGEPSVTRWLDYSNNIWHFTTMYFCPIAWKVAKVGSQFCQILKNLQKWPKTNIFSPKMAKFHQIWSHWWWRWRCWLCLVYTYSPCLHSSLVLIGNANVHTFLCSSLGV